MEGFGKKESVIIGPHLYERMQSLQISGEVFVAIE